MQIKVITFDLDDTLWDVKTVMIRAEQHLRAWLAAEVPEVMELYSGEALRELRTTVVQENPDLIHDLSRLREKVIYRAILECGYDHGEANMHAKAAFSEFYEARHRVEYFEGALETLAVLARDYQLGALTNGNADFQKLQLGQYFSFGFSAANVGVGKPAPQMFQAALCHAGAAPDESIHVGDHLIDDVQGAAAVGMHTIWVNLNDQPLTPDGPRPSGTVCGMSEVPGAVVAIERAI